MSKFFHDSTCCSKHLILPTKKEKDFLVYGDNDYGQLGLGYCASVEIPLVINFPMDIVEVSCGAMHTIMRDSDNLLWAFGNNTFLQLGLGMTGNFFANPQKITYIFEDDISYTNCTDVQSIACGGFFSVMTRQNGDVFACGMNVYNQCGFEDLHKSDLKCFNKIKTLSNVQKISCGFDFTVALIKDGTAFSWGRMSSLPSADNQIGNAMKFPKKIQFAFTIIDIGCGGDFAMLVNEIGQVFVWGNNSHGQTCFLAEKFISTPHLLLALNASITTSIFLGFNHGMAKMKNGTVIVWGNDMRKKQQQYAMRFDRDLNVFDDIHCLKELTIINPTKLLVNQEEDVVPPIIDVPPIVDVPKEEEITCPVCMESYTKEKKPVALECGHLLCFVCFQSIKDINSECPLCRKPFTKWIECFVN